MRIWVPVLAPFFVAAVVLAGCSDTVDGESQPTKLTPLPSSPQSSSSATSPRSTAAPNPGAPIDDVIAWIESGQAADAGAYHTATREGTETQLGDDVAFTTPSGKTSCMTSPMLADGAMACLVKLVDPPPRPDGVEGQWVGDWVDFDGESVSVGSAHADPGPFGVGDGPELPYGKSLKFGDFQCRSDAVGLFCANYAHRTAARFSDTGVEPFGCLKPVTPRPDIGLEFGC